MTKFQCTILAGLLFVSSSVIAMAQSAAENIVVLGNEDALSQFRDNTPDLDLEGLRLIAADGTTIERSLTEVSSQGVRRALILDETLHLAESLARSSDQLRGFDRVTYLTSVTRTAQLEVLYPAIGDNMKIIYLNPEFEERLANSAVPSQDSGAYDLQVHYDHSALYQAMVGQLRAPENGGGRFKPWESGIWMSGIVDGFGRFEPSTNVGAMVVHADEAALPLSESGVTISPMWGNDLEFSWDLEAGNALLSPQQKAVKLLVDKSCGDWDDRTRDFTESTKINFQPLGFSDQGQQ